MYDNINMKKDIKLDNSNKVDPAQKGLTFPESIAGDLDLSGLTSIEGLTLPNSIGRYLSLDSLTSSEKGMLREKYPNLNIE